MTQQEEEFVHLSCCIEWLNNAWRLLHYVRNEPAGPLTSPAFRFALIEYSKPYKASHGTTDRFKLGLDHVPPALRTLHDRIIDSRDKVHAHSDLTLLDARLSVHRSMGTRYSMIVQNKITGEEELPNINDVIALVEGTLDSLYVKHKALESALLGP